MLANVKLRTSIFLIAAAVCAQSSAFAQTANQRTTNRQTAAQPVRETILSNADIAKLIEDAGRNSSRADKKVLLEYAFTTTTTIRYFGKKGNVKETEVETARVYPRYGSQAEVVLSKNGKAVPAEQIAKDEKRLTEELIADEEKRQRYAAELDDLNFGVGIAVGDNETGASFGGLFQAAAFTNPRTVDFNGRPTVLLDFAPRLEAAELDKRIRFWAFSKGQVWIDRAERQPIKLQAFLTENAVGQAAIERAKKTIAPTDFDNNSPSVSLEKARLPDGAYITKSFRIYTMLAPFAFNNVRVDFAGESSDFKRFVADAEEYKPDSKPQPQQ